MEGREDGVNSVDNFIQTLGYVGLLIAIWFLIDGGRDR